MEKVGQNLNVGITGPSALGELVIGYRIVGFGAGGAEGWIRTDTGLPPTVSILLECPSRKLGIALLDGWFEHQYPMIALIRHIDVAVTVYRQTLRLAELPVSAALAPPLAQESALGIEDLDPMIAIF